MKPLSLRMQLALWLLAPLLVLLTLDAWFTHQRWTAAAYAAFDHALGISLKAICAGVRSRDGTIEVDLPDLLRETFEQNSFGTIYYVVREDNGRAVKGYPDLELPARQSDKPQQMSFYDTTFHGESLRMATLQLPVHDVHSNQTRVVRVIVGGTIEVQQAFARAALLDALLRKALLATLVLAVVWLGVGRGLRPLSRLSARFGTHTDDDPVPLDASGLPSDVAPLVDSINQYIAHTQRMELSRRQFFTDAAHQLKTPLAIVQAESELALRNAENGNGGVHLRRLNRAVRLTARILQQLLSLSHFDADSGKAVEGTRVPLHRVARSATSDWLAVARLRGIDLGFEQETRVEVKGQAHLLIELVSNLIDNAIRYAGDGSVITVRVAQFDDRALLEVTDNGPGIASDEREAVFERFYRSSATQSVAGTGLGLSIVREIARVHDAQITLHDATGGGLVVRVVFPLLSNCLPAS
ncbi:MULTISPECIES: sensor histidine kinase [unclassified Paraburkholderia]|uniref:sensor histidine kinase n=1 Tax=unclassified Paraburkholderia TaxID=2615204 RepID=UPI00162189F7|nr:MULTISPECIES: sensor histidine kinase [unclassified Paraburkholderia]